MGRIADAGDIFAEATSRTQVNKVDLILERLDDDDRGVVLSWLNDDAVTCEEIEERFAAFDINCSDSTVRRWRRYQRLGMGRVWVA